MREASFNVLAVGFFDGVHLGHRAILRGADAALTFRRHPLSVIAPDRAPQMIMSTEERVAAIRGCGVREVVVLDFTPETAAMSPAEFLDAARAKTSFSSIRCGANWRFGRGGEGDAEWLRSRGVPVEVVPYAEYEGRAISSSRIRESLRNGDVESAGAMLGRAVSVSAVRFRGKGVGAKIGFPTVNFESASPVLRMMPRGVYEVDCGGARGIANYGIAPTMGARRWENPVVEVYFTDGAVPPERETETVSFMRFIRPERRFGSLDALRAQIAEDCRSLDDKAVRDFSA